MKSIISKQLVRGEQITSERWAIKEENNPFSLKDALRSLSPALALSLSEVCPPWRVQNVVDSIPLASKAEFLSSQ